VDLDANRNLQTVLSQEYSDSVNFSDGEIFQAIRGYHYNSDKQLGSLFAEKCMWARLSMSKRKDLKQILKHEEFTKALDALLVLPGVWIGFRIEHKFMSLKCDEVITLFFLSSMQLIQIRRFCTICITYSHPG
jgi:hypothetical protein